MPNRADNETLITPEPASRPPILIAWSIAVVLIVALRGVRWDETYEFGQAIAGTVPYPEGHPLLEYTRWAYSIQNYLSALLIALGGGPGIVCGLRNGFFLAATVLPVYLIVGLLTRSALWATPATLLLLQGIMLEFDGSYPTQVWPDLYSNGQIGTGWALLAVYALLAERWRLAAFLFAAMPAVHIGQFPPVFAFAAVYIYFRPDRWQIPKNAWPYFTIGIAICAGFYAVQRTLWTPAGPESPYFAAGDPRPIWRGYLAYYDPHRRFPPANGHIITAGVLLLSAAAWRFGRGERLRRYSGWIFVYSAIIAVLVWGIMAIHAVFGKDTPLTLLSWMPYRLINHLPPLALALAAGVLAGAGARTGLTVLSAALYFGAFNFVFAEIFGEALYRRYFAMGDAVAFGLFGAAFGVLAVERAAPFWRYALSVSPSFVLAPFHQFGATCTLLGALCVFVLYGIGNTGQEDVQAVPQRRIAVLACVLAAAFILVRQWEERKWLPRSGFDRRTAALLAERGDADALIAARPDEYMLQARTGHPVLVEAALRSWIPYLPRIAPSIDRIFRDVYGISFAQPAEHTMIGDRAAWEVRWEQRSAEEWAALAKVYGFRYIIAPPSLKLALKPLLVSDGDALYEVAPRD